ncbi:MAG: succinylglutamate desuccinylase/aspartoacylase family protein [Chloroflexi bacterium]|nr:succinylglutamate desuccinylase/aspartoacylase family protein [Chloroflexota bacterium]
MPRATQTPRGIALPVASATPAPPLSALPLVTLLPANPSVGIAAANLAARPRPVFTIGQSAGGQDILAWRFGSGPRTLLLVGGIHAGYEANTISLLNELAAHFEGSPGDVLPGMTLVLVPVANPDGFAQGQVTDGRFNANGVDLNRNWGCEWSAQAYWRNRQVNPGSEPFSEPETRALAALAGELNPAAVIFYHSAANGVFAGDCPGSGISWTLAGVLGEAAGYPYGQPFTAYIVTGTAPNWFDGQGIPSVDVELSGTRDSEFARNLRGVMAVQRWLSGG